ncbi:MAG: 3-deoxy-7-phosphoheptulonate synthase [SAR202 cluster bacterium]|jgi:3-deoxy-7-phosphoheptulonate synthase|nr:3-deoxy-7-phosphoheptulonate synthase [SAR202 cluster bacterium]
MEITSVQDVNIVSTSALISPNSLSAESPITQEIADHVVRGRAQIKDIMEGTDPRLLMIVGPCSIHDETAAFEYAERLVALSAKVSERIMVVMRVYFEKPRTTVGWKGFVYDPNLDDTFDIGAGLSRARALLTKLGGMGVYAATEFLDPIVPQYLADLVTWAAIGARTIESQTHRQMASGLSMPVGFKNSTDGAVQPAVDAMVSARSPHAFLGIDHSGQTCIVQTKGNPLGHLVLRGGNTGSNFSAEAIALAQARLEKADARQQILVDCSHGNSDKDYAKQAIAFRDAVTQRAAGTTNIIGCMIESHLNPGKQSLNGDNSKLEYGVSITDACIGWDETDSLLTWAYDAMGK